MLPGKLILISGKAGSGKSTLQRALLNKAAAAGVVAATARFAGPLYDMQAAALGALVKYGVPAVAKDRRLLQLLGTEWGRDTRGENFWVDLLKHDVQSKIKDGAQLVLVDDLRFKNEMSADFGVATTTVRLNCPDATRAMRLGGALPPAHSSETELDAVDMDYTFNSHTSSAEEIAAVLFKFLYGAGV